MHVALDVPCRDAAAADLLVAVRAGADAPAGLSALRVRTGGFLLELRVLGASHAVLAQGPDGTRLTEVVACGMAAGAPLASSVREVGGLRHAIEVSVEPLAGHAADLRALAGDPGTLVASFPGANDALTAVRALPAGGWATWHLYPATGEAVVTRTTLETAR